MFERSESEHMTRGNFWFEFDLTTTGSDGSARLSVSGVCSVTINSFCVSVLKVRYSHV